MPIPSQRKYDKKHQESIDKYTRQLRSAYLNAIKKTANLAVPLSLNANDEFYFRTYPEVNKAMNKVISELYKDVYGVTVSGINTEWELAVDRNNEIANYVYGTNLENLPKSYIDRILSGNEGAKQAFIKRKINGLDLSDRVWRNTRQFKQELELALELSIGKGQSAANIATNVKQYLNEPNKLFRRVRDKNGVLRLSKNAKSYNPGRGVYRSSYKNAFRLTANETNIAYEASNEAKRNEQDFVVGVRISTNSGHKESDDKGGVSCASLAGDYPKDFKWSRKWHVGCECISFTILKTRDELDSDIDRILDGQDPTNDSINKVNSLPDNFSNYVKDNSKLWDKWKNKPSWLDQKIAKVPKVTNPYAKYSATQIQNAKKRYDSYIQYQTLADYDIETIGRIAAEQRLDYHNNLVSKIKGGDKALEKEWKLFFLNEELKSAQKLEASKAKLAANKLASADILAPIKKIKKLGDFGKWLNNPKNKFRKQYFNKKYTVEAVAEYLDTL